MKIMEFNSYIEALTASVNVRKKARSAWDKGVYEYVGDMLKDLNGVEWIQPSDVPARLLNGAKSWKQYSYGGCALVNDCDIAERLCNAFTLKKVRGGERNPNERETWLDVQARALSQAAGKIVWAAYNVTRTESAYYVKAK